MKIFINNKETEIKDSQKSLDEIISEIKNLPSLYAVALNDKVVSAQDRSTTILRDGDKIMIIKAFYGG